MIKLIFRSISSAMQGIFIGTSSAINYFDQKIYINKDDKLISLYVAMYNVFMMQALLFTLSFAFPGLALGFFSKFALLFLPILAGAANGGYAQLKNSWKDVRYLKKVINVIDNILYYIPKYIKYLLTYLLKILHVNFRHILLLAEIALLFLALQNYPIFAATSLLFMSADTIFYFKLLPISLEIVFSSIEEFANFFDFIFINDLMLRIHSVFRLLLDMRIYIFKRLIPEVMQLIKEKRLYEKFEKELNKELNKELFVIPKSISFWNFLKLMEFTPPAMTGSSHNGRSKAIINELQQIYYELTKSVVDHRELNFIDIIMKLEDLLVKKDPSKNKLFKTSFAHIQKPILVIAKVDPIICKELNKKLNYEDHYKKITYVNVQDESYVDKIKNSAKFKDEFSDIEDEKELLARWQVKLKCNEQDVFTIYIKNRFEEIINDIEMLKNVTLDIAEYPDDKMTLTYHYALNLLSLISTNLEQQNHEFAYTVIMDMILSKNEECDLAIYDIIDELYNKYIKIDIVASLPVKERLQYFLFEHRKKLFNEIYFAICESTLFKALYAFRDPLNRHVYYETLDAYDIEQFMNFYKNQKLSQEDKYFYSLVVRIFMYIENGYSPEYIIGLLNDENANTSVLGFEIDKCRKDWALEFSDETLKNYILELIEHKADLLHIDTLMLWDKQVLSKRTMVQTQEPSSVTNYNLNKVLERLGIDPKPIIASVQRDRYCIELPVRAYIPSLQQPRNNNITVPNIVLSVTPPPKANAKAKATRSNSFSGLDLD